LPDVLRVAKKKPVAFIMGTGPPGKGLGGNISTEEKKKKKKKKKGRTIKTGGGTETGRRCKRGVRTV